MDERRTKWTGPLATWRARHLLSARRQAEAADLLRWAALDLAPDAVVVDLGAGTGLLTVPLAQRLSTGRVVAVDLSKPLLGRLAERARCNGLHGRVEPYEVSAADTGLPDGLATAVVSAMLLHEVPNPSAVLREAFRLLRPGGQLLVRDFVARRLSFVARWTHPGKAYGHLSSADLVERVRGAGFELHSYRVGGGLQDALAEKPG